MIVPGIANARGSQLSCNLEGSQERSKRSDEAALCVVLLATSSSVLLSLAIDFQGTPMSLRMPRAYARQFKETSVDTALNVEMLEEKAAALGRAGKRVEETLAVLQQSTGPDRAAARRAAAEAVYAYLIQRELCGLKDQNAVVRAYGIPSDVMAILGAH
jgi:hypothetical protein